MISKKKQATVRRLLKNFEKEILKANKNVRRDDSIAFGIWSVLTGLRGPDIIDQRDEIKQSTTGIIRLKSLPRLVRYVAYDINSDCEYYAKFRNEMKAPHFKTHAVSAFEALGLEWNSVNKEKNND
jgi:hypothetical protein